jgi:hypothetical protein
MRKFSFYFIFFVIVHIFKFPTFHETYTDLENVEGPINMHQEQY